MSLDAGVDMLGEYTETYTLNVLSGSTNYQLMRAPWPSPVNKKVQILQCVITPTVGTAVGTSVAIWDQDLSNSTPPTRGSAGGALLTLGAAGSAASGTATVSTIFSEHQLPEQTFLAGIALQSTTVNVNIAMTVKLV
jgi:hypothetical protein